MSKQKRQEKKEEERRIIAEMEAAMREKTETVDTADTQTTSSEQNESKNRDIYDSTMPEQIHCRHCRTLMENGVCPACGFRIYVPMSKEKRDKIRLVVASVCMGIFIVLFILLQIQKG